MLVNLHLENFKGFDFIDIPFRAVTLLAGLNSAGKSSVIQALLLLKQIDYQRDPSTAHAELFPNGDFISQGSGRELLHEFATTDELCIACETDKRIHNWRFCYDPLTHRLVTNKTYERSNLLALAELRFSYLSAERWGPRLTYPYEDAEQTEGLGVNGEYAIRYLIDHGDDAVINKNVLHPKAKGVGLIHQVQAWLGELSPGVRIDVKPLRDAGVSVAGFGFERRGDVASRYYRPTHVGFGLTYSLALLVALLSSEPGTVLLLENPEAHLHPRGQAQLARLIALASHNMQIIVETHSDHVMNGLRVAVKRREILPEDLHFHYFRRDGVTSHIDTPQINSDGRLSFWPDGFFDEHERLLAALVRRSGNER
jgi:predicted ATPase